MLSTIGEKQKIERESLLSWGEREAKEDKFALLRREEDQSNGLSDEVISQLLAVQSLHLLIRMLRDHSSFFVSLLIGVISVPLISMALFFNAGSVSGKRKTMTASVMLLQNGIILVVEVILCIKFCLDQNQSTLVINLGLPLLFSAAWLVILNADSQNLRDISVFWRFEEVASSIPDEDREGGYQACDTITDHSVISYQQYAGDGWQTGRDRAGKGSYQPVSSVIGSMQTEDTEPLLQ